MARSKASSVLVEDPLRAYSYEDVAERLGVSVKTVSRLVDGGELRSFRLRGAGRTMRISETALREFFASRDAV